jgi:hypothetical protein
VDREEEAAYLGKNLEAQEVEVAFLDLRLEVAEVFQAIHLEGVEEEPSFHLEAVVVASYCQVDQEGVEASFQEDLEEEVEDSS